MTRAIVSLRVFAACAALSLPCAAAAQDVTSSFDTLAAVLKPGQEVIITTADGRTTAGDVLELTRSSLTLRSQSAWRPEQRRRFERSNVASIRRTDSVWNGVLIGLGAGILAAEVWRRSECGPRGSDDECSAIVFGVGVVTMVPGGAVTGALIDKFNNRLVYRATAGTTIGVMPVASRHRASIGVSLRF